MGYVELCECYSKQDACEKIGRNHVNRGD